MDRYETDLIGHDIAFCADVVKRIASGEIFGGDASVVAEAQAAIGDTATRYSEIGRYKPEPGKPPQVIAIIEQIEDAQAELKQMETENGELEDEE